MAVTGIGDARSPATPVETTFAADVGQPTAVQELLLLGHKAASGGSVSPYVPQTISNAGDPDEAFTEAVGYFGTDAEIAKMVRAAVTAALAAGASVPPIKCIGLANADTGYGSSDQALTAARNIKAEFVVSPYDGVSAGGLSAATTKLRTHAALVSGATRTANNQFGTFGVIANRNVSDPATLPTMDSQYMVPVWLRDSGSPTYSLGELAAATAAVMAANAIPFNPLDDNSVGGLDVPAAQSDWISVGDSSEGETALGKGWTPLYVTPAEEVAIVRSITSRLSVDGTGSPVVNSYYDVQDFQVIYYWRKTLYTRFKQPDFKKKASNRVAKRMLGEMIRLAMLFEDQEMFQAVSQLSKTFVVARASTDRHAFEAKTPVNVVPGLHRKKVNVEATTEFDTIVV